MIDVVIPAHKKDIDTLDLCIDGIRNNVQDVRRIVVVSREKLTENAEFFPESAYPFSLEDVGNIVGFHNRTCKYYGGSLQMTAPFTIPDLSTNILTCDSDTIFLRPTQFIDQKNIALYNVSYDIPTSVKKHPYLEHCEKLITGLTKQTKYSGICHHVLFQKDILQEIFNKVEKKYKMPFWKANLSTTLEHYKSLTHPIQTKNGKPVHADCPLLITTYEFYFNYIMKYHKDRCAIRKLKSILAYKGRLGVKNESTEIFSSRTNLEGNVQILPQEEENKFSFNSFKESFEYICNRCAEKGWDTVTFQNHTRIGGEEDRTRHEKEINEICINRPQ